MDTWAEWMGSTVFLNEVCTTLVAVDADGITLDGTAEDLGTLLPFDVVDLVHASPVSRWSAAVRELDGGRVKLGRPTPDHVDRRRHPRRQLNLPVSLWWSDAARDSSGLTVDLSVGGFAAVLDHTPPPDIEVAVRIEGMHQPLIAVARVLPPVRGEHGRFTFTDIGEEETEVLGRMTLNRQARERAIGDGKAVLWSTVGSQLVSVQVTPLGCVVTGAMHCPPRKEHVVLVIDGALHRAKVVSIAGGVPRLGWLD